MTHIIWVILYDFGKPIKSLARTCFPLLESLLIMENFQKKDKMDGKRIAVSHHKKTCLAHMKICFIWRNRYYKTIIKKNLEGVLVKSTGSGTVTMNIRPVTHFDQVYLISSLIKPSSWCHNDVLRKCEWVLEGPTSVLNYLKTLSRHI